MSRYQYIVQDPPGINVRQLRTARGWTVRKLADTCRPALEHTTITRLEHNQGYTQDTIERVAKALGVKPSDLFLPKELQDWPNLPEKVRVVLADFVKDAASVARYISRKTR